MKIKILNVYFYQKLVGQLLQDNDGKLRFKYLAEYLNSKNPKALSQSLPLQKTPFNEKKCRPYFANILPEYNQRVLIAKNLGISAQNDFSLLEKIGGECAGAVTFLCETQTVNNIGFQYV